MIRTMKVTPLLIPLLFLRGGVMPAKTGASRAQSNPPGLSSHPTLNPR